jgi:undecaprenyl-phosphate 4-deoxy-4-formamido-L-arabinose transferase
MQGQSGYSLGKLLRLWLNGFTSFSVKPLRVATVLGSVFALVGFVFAIVVIIQKLLPSIDVDAGWSSLMCVMLVVGGLLMMMLGIVGEYVGRAYMGMNGAPQYIVRERRNLDGPKHTL